MTVSIFSNADKYVVVCNGRAMDYCETRGEANAKAKDYERRRISRVEIRTYNKVYSTANKPRPRFRVRMAMPVAA